MINIAMPFIKSKLRKMGNPFFFSVLITVARKQTAKNIAKLIISAVSFAVGFSQRLGY